MIQWQNKEYKPIFSYKLNNVQWHIIIHEDFYVFVAEINDECILELMRISPLQHAILKKMKLIDKDKVDEYFRKDLEELLAEGK